MEGQFESITFGYVVEAKGLTAPQFRQVHGSALVTLVGSDPIQDADGGITDRSGFELSTFTADCSPLLFFGTRERDPIAAVHAGWRGACAGIAEKTIDAFHQREVRDHLHVVVGPCLRACCFAVREDFIETFRAEDRPVDRFLEKRGDRWHFALDRYLIDYALAPIAPANRHTELLRCTACSEPRLPSYRRDGSTDPRIRSWIRKN